MTELPLWSTSKSLGVMADVKVEELPFQEFVTDTLLSEDEYVDFEKLPIENPVMAPFAMPLGRGRGVYAAEQRTYRFKPAYVILDDAIDPLKPLTFQAGVDPSMLDKFRRLTPMQRKEVLRARITAAHVRAWHRRKEWLRARAIIDGKVTLSGPDYPETLVDFQRDAGHTITLGSGARFGDSGISAFDFIQARIDQMNDAEFGGMPTKVWMGNLVWAYLRKDSEFLAHMDLTKRGNNVTIERGLVTGAKKGGKVFKVGEMSVGGNSGTVVELWVHNGTYKETPTSSAVRMVGSKQMVFTAEPEDVKIIECFGRIVDEDANYEAIPLFPKNYKTGDAVKTEHIRHTSSPIAVPVNPNATASATVLP